MNWNFLKNLINLLYIYQLNEYDYKYLLKWIFTHRNWNIKNKRKQLVWTQSVKRRAAIVIIFQIILTIIFILSCISSSLVLIVISFTLWIIGYSTIPGLILGNIILWPIIRSAKNKTVNAAREKIKNHPDLIKIGIAGSYGKTSVKEFLTVILNERYKVVCTPGNLNTIWGNARTINEKININTQIFISEMGEYKIGEIAEITKLVQPNIGFLTGINETHIERFKKIENTIQACFEIIEAIPQNGSAYLNVDNINIKDNIKKFGNCEKYEYSKVGCEEVLIKGIHVYVDHTTFILIINNQKIEFRSNLLGKHNIPPLVACIHLGLKLGMNIDEIKEGISKLQPVEHRMNPRNIHDVWLIDDSYNGNFDGFKAGSDFIKDLNTPGRKIVITPGIVELGKESEKIHRKLAHEYMNVFDIVILYPTEGAKFIQNELIQNNFNGDIKNINDIQETTNFLENSTLPNDIIILQNDVAENYL